MDYTVLGILQARILEWVAIPFSRGIFPTQGYEPRSPTLQVDSLPAEPQGKPKNTGVASVQFSSVAQSCPTLCDPMDCTVHGILQARILEWVAFPFSRGIFPTQGSNPGFPHCTWILYQLSHKGNPVRPLATGNRNRGGS